ncbi:MAG: hypothetical protein MUO76_11720 [Anaerolineaceae bacterium]|nr:hypothetical protein [Anaerolineaceae bacterium]
MEEHTQAFADAEHVLFAFPLYTDIMPGLVKTFIETLEPLCGRDDNPSVGFIIHSGFPEALQLRCLERYLQKLTSRLGCAYTGTIIKGGSEGIRFSPPESYKPLFDTFQQLGKTFAETGKFDQAILEKLAQPERFPWWVGLIYNPLARMPLLTKGWDDMLKANNAYKRRYARPFEEKSTTTD